MKRLFALYFLFFLYLEIVFRLSCFHTLGNFNLLLLFFSSLFFSVILTFLSSLLKRPKLIRLVMGIFFVLLTIVFGAELVYFKIYESFFSMNGLFFIGAVKDGYDKVLLTIFQNIGFIILLLIPLVFLFIKFPKKIKQLSKMESFALLFFLTLGIAYSSFLVFFVDRDDDYSFYNLVFKINMPVLNVRNFGLLTASSISLERKIFGFSITPKQSEDILTNKKTSLAESVDIKYNEENIDFATLIKEEQNQEIKALHEYFNRQQATEQNDFTGIFKDKNVIFIVAEAFDEIAIDKDLTPTLYTLKNDGIKFNNYFAPKYPASTADGEYMLEWGILPVIGEYYSLIDMVYNVNPYLLPRILKKEGYKTYAYHNYYENKQVY